MPRTLRGWIVLLAIAAIGLGLLASRVARKAAPAGTRARWAEMAGRPSEAEAIWWGELQRGPVTVPTVVAFLAQHRMAVAMAAFHEPPPDAPPRPSTKRPKVDVGKPIPEADVEAFFARGDLPREVTLVYTLHARGDDPATLKAVRDAADQRPPLPWMNHALAEHAARNDRPLEAATYYEREAAAFGRADDLAYALALRDAAGDRDGVIARLADPTLGPLAPPSLQLRIAIERRDWARALRWVPRASFPPPHAGPLALAAIAALGWGAFCVRLGQLRRAPAARGALYLAAFALGCLSIAPTMFLIEWQEVVLRLTPNGNPVRDLAFYVLGVGFREELSKVLLFLPLLPILLRREQQIEVVACGALVGLGFAAVENLQYFSHGDLTAAIGRYLTANFLHMSMTALTTNAVYHLLRKPDGFHAFTVTFLTVVTLHGVYDFFLASRVLGDLSYFAMTVFVFLARDFVVAMHDARLRAGRSQPLLPAFAIGTTVVSGATFVYASVVVGPVAAADAMFVGLLGVAILAVMFVRQLRVL